MENNTARYEVWIMHKNVLCSMLLWCTLYVSIQLVSSVGHKFTFLLLYSILLSIENVFRICTILIWSSSEAKTICQIENISESSNLFWYANTIKSIKLIFLSLVSGFEIINSNNKLSLECVFMSLHLWHFTIAQNFLFVGRYQSIGIDRKNAKVMSLGFYSNSDGNTKKNYSRW